MRQIGSILEHMVPKLTNKKGPGVPLREKAQTVLSERYHTGSVSQEGRFQLSYVSGPKRN